MRFSRHLVRLALATALALAGTACGTSSGSNEPAVGATSSPASTTGTEPRSSLPDGLQLVSAQRAGLTFGAPEEWTVVDPAKFSDPDRQERYRAMAEDRGMTLSDFQDATKLLDVLVSSAGNGGFDNVNVTRLTIPEIPDPGQVRLAFEERRGDAIEIEDISTPVGRGRIARFTAEIGSAGTAFGASLYLDMRNGVANLTITALSAARLDELEKQILPTLADVG